MGTPAANSVLVLRVAAQEHRSHLPIGLFRFLKNRSLRRCEEKIEQDIRWLRHDGVLADFNRASHG